MDNGASSYRRYLEGDDEGIVEIIRDYKDGLILWLCGFTKDICKAEELCEDVFVKIAVKKPNFSGKSSFKTFLYTIGRNLALDALRKPRNVSLDEIAEVSSGEYESLEKAYLREERKIAVHKALSTLKTEYREVLWLMYFEELSGKEIAAVMKKSVHAVETLASRARKALKVQLEKDGVADSLQ